MRATVEQVFYPLSTARPHFREAQCHRSDGLVELLDGVGVPLAVGGGERDQPRVDALERPEAEGDVVGGLVLEPAQERVARGGVVVVRGLALVGPRHVGAADGLVAEADSGHDAGAAGVGRAAVLGRDAQAHVVDGVGDVDGGLHGVAGLVGGWEGEEALRRSTSRAWPRPHGSTRFRAWATG